MRIATNKIVFTSSKKIDETHAAPRRTDTSQQITAFLPQPTRRPRNQIPRRTRFTRKFFVRAQQYLLALAPGRVFAYPQLLQQYMLKREHTPSVSPDFTVSTRYRRHSLAQFDRWRTARGRGLRLRTLPTFTPFKPRRSRHHKQVGRMYVRRAVVFRRRLRIQLLRVLRRRDQKHFVQLVSRL